MSSTCRILVLTKVTCETDGNLFLSFFLLFGVDLRVHLVCLVSLFEDDVVGAVEARGGAREYFLGLCFVGVIRISCEGLDWFLVFFFWLGCGVSLSWRF